MAAGGSGFQIEWLLSLPMTEFTEWCKVYNDYLQERAERLKSG